MQDVLVTPFQTGLVTSVDEWSIPTDAFTSVVNFSINQGRLEKRAGRSFMGQMVNNAGVITERVMGLSTYVRRSGPNITVANSLTRMNYWNGASPGAFVNIDGTTQRFNSGSTDYFWYSNWQPPDQNNRLFITNGVELSGTVVADYKDGIRYYDYETDPTVTVKYIPTVSTGITLVGCRMIFTLSGRLVVLYTYENNGASTTFFPQRARWSKYQNATEANWNDTVPGNGDFVDAATGDTIVSAQYHKDGLLVFFTNSVWLLYPTQDPRIAFAWKRLNSYRACDGRMASQSFDDYSTALGVRGIFASTGAQTQRIDERIENFGNDIINVNQFNKVYCARSYQARKWWTLYADLGQDEVNKVLVFHEDNKTWTTYDTDLNVLGYGVNSFDLTFSDFAVGETFQDYGEDTFQSFNQDNEPIFIGGDRGGMVYQLEQGGADDTSSSTENPITCSFQTGILNPWKDQGHDATLLYVDFLIETNRKTKATVAFYKDGDVDEYKEEIMDFLPPLGFIATIQNITNANPAVVTAYNHGLSTGDNIFIYGVEGFADTASPPFDINSGPYEVTVLTPHSFSLAVDSSAFSAYSSDGSIFHKEFVRTKIWKRVYAGGSSMMHAFSLSSTGSNTDITIIGYRATFKKIGAREIN